MLNASALEGSSELVTTAGSAPAVNRAIAILNFVSERSGPTTLHLLSSSLGLPKSSTLGICRVLVHQDFLQQDEFGGYTVGIGLIKLAGRHVASLDVTKVFHQVADRIEYPDWSVQLAVLDGAQVVYLARRDGVNSIGIPSSVGKALPSSTTAVGKAMLAQYPDAQIAALFADPNSLSAGTAKSISSLEQLTRELRLARERGFALDRSETVQGVLGIAAPVFSLSKEVPVAAVSLAMADRDRSDKELDELGRQVKEIAAGISTSLGALDHGGA